MKREESEALKTLKGNEDIVITPADKGCSIVVMDKPEYEINNKIKLCDYK